MTRRPARARLAAGLLGALTLAAAWAVWAALPQVIGLLGLGRFDLLLRVLLLFAVLSLAETLAGLPGRWLKPPAAHKETPHDP